MFFSLPLYCVTIQSEEKSNQPVDNEPTTQTTTSKLEFFAGSLKLNNSLSADDLFTINVMESQHDVLVHHASGRKKRGNILFFHAQGENPDHLRLVQPMAIQFSQLGWNVYLPNIAIESFPVTSPKNISSEKDTATTDSDNKKNDVESNPTETNTSTTSLDESKQFSFKSFSAYQDYFSALCLSLIKHPKISNETLIIIANQNSAYWSLDCLAQSDDKISVVFLQPQQPLSAEKNLKDKFSKLSNPLFSFQSKRNKKSSFQKAFEGGYWKSNSQRFNIGMLSPSKIQIEDFSVAKTITGWIEKQKKEFEISQ